MSKTQEEFLDNFARLGVFSKVQSLMGNLGEGDSDVIKSECAIKGLFLAFENNVLLFKQIICR